MLSGYAVNGVLTYEVTIQNTLLVVYSRNELEFMVLNSER